jgi:DNA polymerase III epsilon subunit-like protein
VYLDIETTGKEKDDQIVELAIVDEAGKTLFCSLVNPTCDIHPKAYGLHLLSKDHLKDAPCIDEIDEQVAEILRGKHVVMFFEEFDLRYLTPRMLEAIGSAHTCCQRKFFKMRCQQGRPRGEKADLDFAARFVNHKWTGQRHRALPDAMACRDVYQYVRLMLRGMDALEDVYF